MSPLNEDSGRPLLLTGASGFIGAWILRRAVEAGQPVIACDLARDDAAIDRRRFTQIAPALSSSALITWQALDVTDAEAVSRTVAQYRPRALIHLAALQIPDCARNPRLGALVNILGHINLLEAAREQGGLPLVYGSSAAAKPRGPAAAPANLYGVYKKTGEEISRLYWQDPGVPSIGLRPYIVYGIGREIGRASCRESV